MEKELKALVKLAKMLSSTYRYDITISGSEYTASNSGVRATYVIPTTYAGGYSGAGVLNVSADDITKIANSSKGINLITIEIVSSEKAIINGVHVRLGSKESPEIKIAGLQGAAALPLSGSLLAAVKEVRPCVSNDAALRPILTGVYIEGNNVIATDAHIMAWRTFDNTLPESIQAVIRPEFFDFMPAGCEAIQVCAGGVVAESENGRIVCKRPSGIKYPNWRAVLPSSKFLTGRVTVSGKALKDALKQAKARKMDTHVLVIRDSACGVAFYESVRDGQDGNQFNVALPCKVTGAETYICLRTRYLNAVLEGIEGDITFEHSGSAAAPLVINGCALIMPVINSDDLGGDYHPEKIELQAAKPEKAETSIELEPQIVELPDGTRIAIGGKKPKGGQAIKAWMIK